MKSGLTTLSQLFLRLALSSSYLSAVADRLGFWGKPGDPKVVWGNWENFLKYSNSVNSFVPENLGYFLAATATVLEVLIALMLLFGFRTRFAALLSGCLLLCFAMAMTISFGIKAPLDYSVFTGAAASFLLAAVSFYHVSIDEIISRQKS